MDLRERLDRELGEPPHPAPDLSETLIAGRRAVRRRRAATGVVCVAAAAVVGGLGWALNPLNPLNHETPVATADIPVDGNPRNDCHEISEAELGNCRSTSEAIHSGPGRSPVRRDPGVRVLEVIDSPLESDGFNAAYEVDDNGARAFVLFERHSTGSSIASFYPRESEDIALSTWVEEVGNQTGTGPQNIPQESGDNSPPPAEFNPDGELVIAEGAEVVQRIEDPLGLEDEGKSLGLAVKHDGQTIWMVLEWTPGRETISSGPAQEYYATLEDSVEAYVAENQGTEAHVFVEFKPDGTLRPLDGVEIVEQRTDVDMDPSPDVRDEVAAVAKLLVDGEPWFVVGFGSAARPEFDTMNTPKAGETLDEFIAYYRDQNTEGEDVW